MGNITKQDPKGNIWRCFDYDIYYFLNRLTLKSVFKCGPKLRGHQFPIRTVCLPELCRWISIARSVCAEEAVCVLGLCRWNSHQIPFLPLCLPIRTHTHNLFKMISPASLGNQEFKLDSTLNLNRPVSLFISFIQGHCPFPIYTVSNEDGWVYILQCFDVLIFKHTHIHSLSFCPEYQTEVAKGMCLVIRPKSAQFCWG